MLSYLRMTPTAHRSKQEVAAEVAWLLDMSDAGLSVARPLPAADGRFVVDVIINSLADEGSSSNRADSEAAAAATPLWTGVAAMFRSVGGRPFVRPADFTAPIVRAWADLLARMHLHAIARQSPSARDGRKHWAEDAVLRSALKDEAAETAGLRACLLQV